MNKLSITTIGLALVIAGAATAATTLPTSGTTPNQAALQNGQQTQAQAQQAAGFKTG